MITIISLEFLFFYLMDHWLIEEALFFVFWDGWIRKKERIQFKTNRDGKWVNVGTNKSNWGEHKTKENEFGLNFWRTKIVVFWNYVVNWQQFLRKIGWFNRVGFRKVTEQYNENTLQQWKWKYIIFIRKFSTTTVDCFFPFYFQFLWWWCCCFV